MPAAGALALFALGCDSGEDTAAESDKTKFEDVKQEASEAARTAGDYMHEQFDKLRDATFEKKAEFEKEAEEAMDDLEMSWAKLKESTAELGENAGEKGQEAAHKLEELSENARTELEEVGNSSAEAWGETRDGFVAAYEELKQAVSDAREEFGSKE